MYIKTCFLIVLYKHHFQTKTALSTKKQFKTYCIFTEFSLEITKKGEMESIFLTLRKNF